MASELAQRLFFCARPPSVTGVNIVQNTAAGVSATSFDWTSVSTPAGPLGNCHLALEALAQDVYVRFGPTSTTGTTSLNGRIIKAGAPAVVFYCSPKNHRFIDLITLVAGGTLKVQVASPMGERVDI